MSPTSAQPPHLLDNLTTAVLLLDGDHMTIEYLNPAAEMLLAASLARVKHQPLASLFQEADQRLDPLQEAVDSGHPFTKRESELQLHNGDTITVDYTVTPLSEHQQTQLIVEIDPRDRLLRISREEDIFSKQETVRVLVRGMAHEIKNPLGGIRGAAQLLERALPDESLHDYTRVIIEEADRLRNLVDRMLGPRTLPDMQLLNIHAVLERVYALAEAEFGERVQLIRDYDPSLPELTGDQEQLIQAVLNIVRNGIQAITESGQTNGRIRLQTRARRQFTLGMSRHRLVCQVRIIDNGPGIPSEILEKIFYPMVSGRAEGTGLGLTIAQSVVQQHGGLIECISHPGRTEFSLLLPFELDDKNDPNTPTHPLTGAVS
ncbi:PAS domain-containing sensor histidine kinase [Terasakiispira papahanaumokuakeensis]|uniref:Sensory histidine kinase/phosphatase NtrB n=1 Tax=Terasakiispira papahanaumokuakeensis TaxID=197479 RepID=A0A1E2VBY2_9GAMM|nr:nitrogen regulation protein NR(II) [Terasakiispira papahanaumokuakeensis]ODC04520.1 PAS domain-containing sensor histidine kinase [Terasakiispira papahanaumokuakeensis]